MEIIVFYYHIALLKWNLGTFRLQSMSYVPYLNNKMINTYLRHVLAHFRTKWILEPYGGTSMPQANRSLLCDWFLWLEVIQK